METATTSMAHDRARLPWPPDGFESLIIRRWRRRVEDGHAAAEEVL